MKEKSLICVVAASLVAMWVIVGFVVALTSWNGTITWTVENKQFSVWDSSTLGTELHSPYLPSTQTLSMGPHTFDFWLQNDGNTVFTVTVEGDKTVWGNGGSWLLSVGVTRVLAQLTLTVSVDGSYSWRFVIA